MQRQLAPSAAGPYTFHGFTSPPGVSGGFVGDFALFVDDDGTAYTILTHGIDGAGIAVDAYISALYRLSDIWHVSGVLQRARSSASVACSMSSHRAQTSVLPGPHLVEAPAFFKSWHHLLRSDLEAARAVRHCLW